MLSPRWRDTKVKSKVKGIVSDHKYFDRPRTMAIQQNMIDTYLKDYKDPECKKCKVLDVSTGTGIFVELMNDLGHNAQGTEIPDCPYQVFHKSQKINVVYHDSVEPFPFKKQEFELVACIGAFSKYPEDKIEDIFKDLFRIAKKTVFVGINRGDIYDRNKETFNKIPKGWRLTIQNGTFYRWDRK
jgi:2-polyprenyl-3-methyl-5-hydroxy-6-metoxy-1,4-benzoquinol methylase